MTHLAVMVIPLHMSDQLTAEDAAACHVRIFRCHGRHAKGAQPRCHLAHEPGFDVGLGMICLNTVPLSLEDALAFAKLAKTWVARIIQYERDGRHLRVTAGPVDLDAVARELVAEYPE